MGRSGLRAVESCAAALAPIAELQYRSQWFSHPNGRDWTVRAFLSNSEKGLGLQVADDAEANAIMLAALPTCSMSASTGSRSRFSTQTSSAT